MTKYQLEENKIVKVQEGNKFLGSFRMPRKLKKITLNAAIKKEFVW